MFKTILKYGIILFSITAIVAATLAGVNILTENIIAKRELQEQDNAILSVINGIDYDNSIEKTPAETSVVKELWAYEEGSTVVAYVAHTRTAGYGGDIDMIVGFDANGNVLNIKVLYMSETPGLGSLAGEEVFLKQYTGMSQSATVVKSVAQGTNEVVAVSGATVSTNAINRGVNAAIQEVQALVIASKPVETPPPELQPDELQTIDEGEARPDESVEDN